MQRTSSRYTFGRFQLDAGERRLLRDGQPVALTPKAFDTLLALMQHAGHVVSKDDLMRAVWPDGYVEESNLAFNISTLRKALREGQNGERFIETVPKLGYRFVMPVTLDSNMPPVSTQAKRTNLPAHLTRFIGREHELAEVTALVQQKRLMTLTGSGGVGKTRLAMEAGAHLLDQFPDGVWLAEFAPLADEALVPATVVGLFHLQEQPGRSLLDTLIALITERHMLLIFDNCEHVIASSAALAEALLKACPNLHILATSREALRLAGEAVWRVPSLDVPDAKDALLPDHALNFDAVQLFVEHASLVQSNFALTQNNIEAVVSICRRLDGIPLAIEMAAAQLDALNVREIAAELEHRFDLLTSGNRTAVPRQQTLRATLDWSYNLLSEPERVLLVRLSVFRGGFTAGAVQVIGETQHQTLMQLVRKSLVMTFVNDNVSQPRYRLLETIQLYADEKLRERNELDDAQDQHLHYFLNLAEEPIELAGPRVDPWVQRMDVELDNVRTAFARAMQRNDHAEMAMRLVYAMTKYGYHRGHMAELKSWAEQAWAQGEGASIFARARGKMALAGTHMMSGAKSQAIRYCEEALSLFRQSSDRQGLADCLEVLANNSYDEHVKAYADEALVLCRELGSIDGESRALRALGVAALQAGDRVEAADYLMQAMQIADWDIAVSLELLYEADSERALALCAGELAQLNASSNPKFAATVLEAYGMMLLMERNTAQARTMLEQAVRGWERIGKQKPLDLVVLAQPLPLDISELELAGWVSVVCDYSFTFLGLGSAELSLNNFSYAQVRLQQARNFAHRAGIIWLAAIANLLQIHSRMQAGQADSLSSDVHESLKCLNNLGEPLGKLCALIQFASITCRQGRTIDLRLATQWLGAVATSMTSNPSVTFYGSRFLILWLRDVKASMIVPALAAARAQLGDTEFEAAYAAGQQMTLDEAVALALNG